VGSGEEIHRVNIEGTLSLSSHLHSGNSPIPFCHTFVTLHEAHLRPGAIIMSRTIRTLAFSAALLAATTASAFACAPGGTNPPPKGTIMAIFLSYFGM
jgi:hypothetical protein